MLMYCMTLRNAQDMTLTNVDATEYEEVRDACNKFLLVLNSTLKVEAITRLRELLPPSKSDISDDDLLFKYWREL